MYHSKFAQSTQSYTGASLFEFHPIIGHKYSFVRLKKNSKDNKLLLV